MRALTGAMKRMRSEGEKKDVMTCSGKRNQRTSPGGGDGKDSTVNTDDKKEKNPRQR